MSTSMKRGQHQSFRYGKEILSKPYSGQAAELIDQIFPDSIPHWQKNLGKDDHKESHDDKVKRLLIAQ